MTWPVDLFLFFHLPAPSLFPGGSTDVATTGAAGATDSGAEFVLVLRFVTEGADGAPPAAEGRGAPATPEIEGGIRVLA